MTSIVSTLMTLGVTAAMMAVAIDGVIEAGNNAVEALDKIGREERIRQEQIRIVACEAFPTDCGPPVPPWPGAEAFFPTTTTTTIPITTTGTTSLHRQ